MVYQVRRAVNVPIIGLGGIMTGEDAAEFILAGADAISGIVALVNPTAPVDIKRELVEYMECYGFKNLAGEVRGALNE